MLEEVLNQIGRRSRFVLTSHARPDGDAIGSVLACSQILRSMGKQADVYLYDGVPQIYRPLPFSDSVVQTPRIPGRITKPPSSWNAIAFNARGSRAGAAIPHQHRSPLQCEAVCER